MKYADHNCPEGNARDVQVPVCPLCNSPVPSKRGEPPDIAVGDHIDRDCQADPAIGRRKVYKNKCNMKGCRKKELIPFVCQNCLKNFCVSHRHPCDHHCQDTHNTKLSQTPKEPSNEGNRYEKIQGNLNEDEALARAIALSLASSNNDAHLRGSEQRSNIQSGSRSVRNPETQCIIC